MSQVSPQPQETPRFSYAAAAASRTPSSSALAQTKSPASRSGVSTPVSNNANGATDEQEMASAVQLKSESQPAGESMPQSERQSREVSRQSSPSHRTASGASKNESESESRTTAPDDEQSTVEKTSENEEEKPAGDEPAAARPPAKLTDAPPPAVNPWTQRQEMQKKQAKSPGASTPPSASASPSVESSTAKNSGVVKKTEPERQATRSGTPSSEGATRKKGKEKEKEREQEKKKEKGQEKEQEKEEKEKQAEEQKAPAESTEQNGSAAADEGAAKPFRPAWKNPAPTGPPPPVMKDTVSWPAPSDLTTAEPKKDKKDEREREKTEKSEKTAAPAGKKGWKTVPLDDLVYTPPPQVKSSRGGNRGSGGRGARDAGRASISGDRTEGTAAGEGQTERGRNGSSSNARGGYQGSKGPKRSSSANGNTRRRESKDVTNNASGGKKRDAAGEFNLDGQSRTSSVGMQTEPTSNHDPAASESYPNGMTNGHRAADQPHSGENSSANGQSAYSRSERAQAPYGRGEGDGSIPYQGGPGGGDRGGRGYRGGRGAFRGSGHHAAGYPQVPFNPAFSSPYPAHQRGGFKGGRGGYYTANAGYRPNPQMQPPPFSPQYQAPYEMAFSYNNDVISRQIHDIQTQLNYYFSLENLLKDVWLRQHMNSDGYIPLSIIADFPKMKKMTDNIDLVKEAAVRSPEVDFLDNGHFQFIRPRNSPTHWVFPPAERHSGARNDYADLQNQASVQQMPTQQWGAQRNSDVAPSGQHFYPQHAAPVPGYAGVSAMYPQPGYNSGYNQYSYPSGQAAGKSDLSASAPEFRGPVGHANGESLTGPGLTAFAVDEFDKAYIDQLILVTKRQTAEDEGKPKANGIDARPVNDLIADAGLSNGNAKLSSSDAKPPPLHRSQDSRNDIGWVIGDDEKLEAPGSVARGTTNHKSYGHYHDKSIRQRKELGAAHNSDMAVLYHFWSHFLVKKYNTTMYKEFKTYALEDADVGSRKGLDSLLKFYSRYFLERRDNIGLNVMEDMIKIADAEVLHGQSPGVDLLKSLLADNDLNAASKHKLEGGLTDVVRRAMEDGISEPEESRSPATYVMLVL